MYKKMLKNTIVHVMMLTFLGILFYTDKIVKDDMAYLQLFNIIMSASVFSIGVEISNNKIKFRTSIIFTILANLPVVIGAFDSVGKNFEILSLSYIFIIIYILRYVKLKKLKNINLIPIPTKELNIFIFAFVIYSGLLTWIFKIDDSSLVLMSNLTLLYFEVVLTLYLRKQEKVYDKIYKLYYLSDHIGQEREEFARVIHDDIVQDIFASKNYLSTKDPDLGFVKEILTDLEDKARGIMKYYQSNVYDDIDVGASLEHVFANIASLYKGKDLDLKMDIDPEAANLKDKKLKRLLLLVSKELVNNIYKHSEGTYLNYSLSMEDGKVLINLESDGATKEDFKKIQDSKRGILILTLLVESNSGKINYDLKGDKLFTQVLMEVREN